MITAAQQGRDITVIETLSQAAQADVTSVCAPVSVPEGVLLPHATPGTPSLSGQAVIGGQLTLIPGNAGTADQAEYRWYRDGALLPGVTGLSYDVISEATIYAEQRNRRSGVSEWSAWVGSNAIITTYPAPVAAGALADLSFEIGTAPQIIDAATDFANAAGGAWSVTGPGAMIDAAGRVTLTLGGEISGAVISVTYTNSGGADTSAFSLSVTNPLAFSVTGADEVDVTIAQNADLLITPTPDAWGDAPYRLTAAQADALTNAPHLLSAGTVTGMPVEGATLTYTSALWATDGDGPELTRDYQWFADGVAIPGATERTLTITPDLAGSAITISESGTQFGYTPVTQSSETPGFYAAQADSIVLIGASFMWRTAGQDLSAVSAEATPVFQAAGVTLPVYGYGFSGEDTNGLRARIDAAASAHPNALMIVHIGGNDVSESRPFATRTQAQIDAYDAAVDALIATCQQYGQRVQWGSVSFRDYGGNLTTFIDPNKGSKPYNDGVLLPKLAAGLPHCIGSGGRPHYDFYRNGLLDFENLLADDNIHPKNPEGEAAWLAYIAQVTADMIDGRMPPEISERIYVPTPSVNGYFLNFGTTAPEFGVTSFDDLSQLNTPLPLIGSDGTISPYTVTVASNGVPGTFDNLGLGFNFDGRASGGAAFDRSGLYFDTFTQASLYGGRDITNTVTLSGFDPGQEVDVSMTASRTTGTVRETRLTDGVVALTYNATANPVTQPVTDRFTADGQGRVVLMAAASVGTFSYIGALQIEPVTG